MKPLPAFAAACLLAFTLQAWGQSVDTLAGKRVVFLGDSITQAGDYVSFTAYYLDKLHPQKSFDIYALGLSSETLSGLSEPKHPFPRPCLFERLGRALEKAKPEVVFACYGMNDGIYMPLDDARFDAFKQGVRKMIEQCQAAGVKEIFLLTPPMYDYVQKPGENSYEEVLQAYATWMLTLQQPGVHVIDLHTPMRKARESRKQPFSKDRIHPGDDGHLLMARTVLAALGVQTPEAAASAVKADPLFKLVDQKRKLRAGRWMAHIGYTRGKTVRPGSLGDAEEQAAKLQEQIDALRRKP